MREADVLPPFFVLALESRMRMQTIIDKLNTAALVTIPPDKPCPAATPQPPIDAVCILGKGLALYQRRSVGPIFHILTTGTAYQGWFGLGDDDTPLAKLLAWLHTTNRGIVRPGLEDYFLSRSCAPRHRWLSRIPKGSLCAGLARSSRVRVRGPRRSARRRWGYPCIAPNPSSPCRRKSFRWGR